MRGISALNPETDRNAKRLPVLQATLKTRLRAFLEALSQDFQKRIHCSVHHK